ncbi:hypothetical protein FPOA_01984 [Fusarium poae]|uniref:Uncharacterized protein n=1 Tax=Fusarium poae TaxID=36050 RepID=A0A1B8B5P4_FUSPO|nr:hypothetical protein FPOA_01984 [Fusarium poae]
MRIGRHDPCSYKRLDQRQPGQARSGWTRFKRFVVQISSPDARTGPRWRIHEARVIMASDRTQPMALSDNIATQWHYEAQRGNIRSSTE